MLIDSLHNKKKHIRHEAVRFTPGGWAHTRCGRKLIYYTNADNLSWLYTDGTRYAWPCRVCLPDEYAESAEEQSR
jgi:hypothetical protein